MYGPASGGGGRGDAPGGGGGRGFGGRERRYTPRGEMSGGSNQRPPLLDLPPQLKMMFEPNPPIEHKPLIIKKSCRPLTGISAYADFFERGPPPEREKFLLPAERKAIQQERLFKLNKEKNEQLAEDWDPQGNPKATENAYHTLFVGRLSYDTTYQKLKREFEQYGVD